MKARKNFYTVLLQMPIVLFCVTIILPFITAISTSFSGASGGKFSFWPATIDLTGYKLIFTNPSVILYGYITSVSVTVIGTTCALIVTTGLSYALSRYDFKYRNKLSFYVYFTMLFSGGLVPQYILITQYLRLKDSIWALILPYLVQPFYVLMLRVFMRSIPFEIIESCYIDGAGEFRIFAYIVLPLARTGIATIAIFITFIYWNDWWLALLYLESSVFVPLQLVLTRIMINFTFLTSSIRNIPVNVRMNNLPVESMRMGMALLAAAPMLIAFPFFQEYFIKGITLGSLKG